MGNASEYSMVFNSRVNLTWDENQISKLGQELSNAAEKIDWSKFTDKQKEELQKSINQAKGMFTEQTDAEGNITGYSLTGDLRALGTSVIPSLVREIQTFGRAVTDITRIQKAYGSQIEADTKLATAYRTMVNTGSVLKGMSEVKLSQNAAALYGDVARMVEKRYEKLSGAENRAYSRAAWQDKLTTDAFLRSEITQRASNRGVTLSDSEINDLIGKSTYALGARTKIKNIESRIAPKFESTPKQNKPSDIFGNKELAALFERGGTRDTSVVSPKDKFSLAYSAGLYEDIRHLQEKGNKVVQEMAIRSGLAKYDRMTDKEIAATGHDKGLVLRWNDNPTRNQMLKFLGETMQEARKVRRGQAIFERNPDLNNNINKRFREILDVTDLFAERANGDQGEEFIKRFISPAGSDVKTTKASVKGSYISDIQDTTGKIPAYGVPYTTVSKDGDNIVFEPRNRNDMQKVVRTTGQLRTKAKDKSIMLQNSQLTYLAGYSSKDDGSFGYGYDKEGNAKFVEAPTIVAMPVSGKWERDKEGHLKQGADKRLTVQGEILESAISETPMIGNRKYKYVSTSGETELFMAEDRYNEIVANARRKGVDNPFEGYDPTTPNLLVYNKDEKGNWRTDYGNTNKLIMSAKRIATQGVRLAETVPEEMRDRLENMQIASVSLEAQDRITRMILGEQAAETKGLKNIIDGAGLIDPTLSPYSFQVRGLGYGLKGVLGNYDWRDFLKQTVKATPDALNSPFMQFAKNDEGNLELSKFFMPSVAFSHLDEAEQNAIIDAIINNKTYKDRNRETLLNENFHDMMNPLLGAVFTESMLKTPAQMTVKDREGYINLLTGGQGEKESSAAYQKRVDQAVKAFEQKEKEGLTYIGPDGRTFVRLNAEEAAKNTSVSLAEGGGLFAVKSDEDFHTGKRYIGQQLAEAIGFGTKERQRSAQLYAQLFDLMETDDYWINQDQFSLRPDIQNRFNQAEDKAWFIKNDPKALAYIEDQKKGARKRATTHYMLDSDTDTKLAFPFLGDFFSRGIQGSKAEINEQSDLAWMYSSMLQDPSFLKTRFGLTDKEISKISTDGKVNIEQIMFSPETEKMWVMAGRTPSALNTFSRMLNVAARGASANKVMGGGNVAMASPQALDRMNTGDFDGDTLWMYTAATEAMFNNMEAYNKIAKVDDKTKAEIDALLKEQQEQLTVKQIDPSFARRISDAEYNYFSSQGEMGKASAIMRNALDLYDLSRNEKTGEYNNPEDVKKFMRAYNLGSAYYDKATSEGLKMGWVGDYFHEAVKGSYLAGRQYDRFKRDVGDFYTQAPEDREDSIQSSIFKNRLLSLNNVMALGNAVGAGRMRNQYGIDFGFSGMVDDWLMDNYGANSEGYNKVLFDVASQYADILKGQYDLSYLVSNSDLEKFFSQSVAKLEVEKTTTSSKAVKERIEKEIENLQNMQGKATNNKDLSLSMLTTDNLDAYVSALKRNPNAKDTYKFLRNVQSVYRHRNTTDEAIANAEHQELIEQNEKRNADVREAARVFQEENVDNFIGYWSQRLKNETPSVTTLEQYIRNTQSLPVTKTHIDSKGQTTTDPNKIIRPNLWSENFQANAIRNIMSSAMGFDELSNVDTQFGTFVHDVFSSTILDATKAGKGYTDGSFLAKAKDLWDNGKIRIGQNEYSYKDYFTNKIPGRDVEDALSEEDWKTMSDWLGNADAGAVLPELATLDKGVRAKFISTFSKTGNNSNYFLRNLFGSGRLFEAENMYYDANGNLTTSKTKAINPNDAERLISYRPDLLWENNSGWIDMYDWKPSEEGAGNSIYQMIHYAESARKESLEAYRKYQAGGSLTDDDKEWLKYRDVNDNGRFKIRNLIGKDYTGRGSDIVFDYASQLGQNEFSPLIESVLKDYKTAEELFKADRESGTGAFKGFELMMKSGLIKRDEAVPEAFNKWAGNYSSYGQLEEAINNFTSDKGGNNFSGADYIENHGQEWNYLVAKQARNRESLDAIIDNLRGQDRKYKKFANVDREYSQFDFLYDDLSKLNDPELIGALASVYKDVLPYAIQDIGNYENDRQKQQDFLRNIVTAASTEDPLMAERSLRKQLYGAKESDVFDRVQKIISSANVSAGSRQSLKKPYDAFFNLSGSDQIWDEAGRIQNEYAKYNGSFETAEAQAARDARLKFITDRLNTHFNFQENGLNVDAFMADAGTYAAAQENIDKLRATESELIDKIFEEDRKQIDNDVLSLTGKKLSSEERVQLATDKQRKGIVDYIANAKLDQAQADTNIDNLVNSFSADFRSNAANIKDAAKSGNLDKLNEIAKNATKDDAGIFSQIRNLMARKESLQGAITTLSDYLDNGFNEFIEDLKLGVAKDDLSSQQKTFAAAQSLVDQINRANNPATPYTLPTVKLQQSETARQFSQQQAASEPTIVEPTRKELRDYNKQYSQYEKDHKSWETTKADLERQQQEQQTIIDEQTKIINDETLNNDNLTQLNTRLAQVQQKRTSAEADLANVNLVINQDESLKKQVEAQNKVAAAENSLNEINNKLQAFGYTQQDIDRLEALNKSEQTDISALSKSFETRKAEYDKRTADRFDLVGWYSGPKDLASTEAKLAEEDKTLEAEETELNKFLRNKPALPESQYKGDAWRRPAQEIGAEMADKIDDIVAQYNPEIDSYGRVKLHSSYAGSGARKNVQKLVDASAKLRKGRMVDPFDLRFLGQDTLEDIFGKNDENLEEMYQAQFEESRSKQSRLNEVRQRRAEIAKTRQAIADQQKDDEQIQKDEEETNRQINEVKNKKDEERKNIIGENATKDSAQSIIDQYRTLEADRAQAEQRRTDAENELKTIQAMPVKSSDDIKRAQQLQQDINDAKKEESDLTTQINKLQGSQATIANVTKKRDDAERQLSIVTDQLNEQVEPQAPPMPTGTVQPTQPGTYNPFEVDINNLALTSAETNRAEYQTAQAAIEVAQRKNELQAIVDSENAKKDGKNQSLIDQANNLIQGLDKFDANAYQAQTEQDMLVNKGLAIAQAQHTINNAQYRADASLAARQHGFEQYNKNRYWQSTSRFANEYRAQSNYEFGLTQQRDTLKDKIEGEKVTQAKWQAKLDKATTDEDKAAAAAGLEASTKALNGYEKELDATNEQLDKFNPASKMFAAGMKSVSGTMNMLMSRFGRQLFSNAIRETTNFVKQFDASMNTIQMITLKSDEQISKLGDSLIDKAKDLKISVAEVSQSAATLYRQGLSDEEVDERLGVISKFSKVSGTKVDAATKLITVAMNTGLVQNAETAADIVTALGDNAATNAAEIEKGIEKAGAAAAADGTSFAELSAMLTAITSTTQIGGNVAGRTLNTIFGRMNKIGTNELIYDENGNAVSGSAVAKLLEAQGIRMYDEQGNKRSTYETLYALSQKWEGMSDAEQQQMANAIAGTRQYSNFAAIMSGMTEGKVSEYLALAGESEGITDKKFQIYEKSLAASITDLKNTWDGLVNDMTDSGALTGALGFFTNFIEGIDKANAAAGGLGATLMGLAPTLMMIGGLKAGGAVGLGVAAVGGLGMFITSVIGARKTAEERYNEEVEDINNRYNTSKSDIDEAKRLRDKSSNRTEQENIDYEKLLSKLSIKVNLENQEEEEQTEEQKKQYRLDNEDEIIQQAENKNKINRIKRFALTKNEMTTAAIDAIDKVVDADNADEKNISSESMKDIFETKDIDELAYKFINADRTTSDQIRTMFNELDFTKDDRFKEFDYDEMEEFIEGMSDFTKYIGATDERVLSTEGDSGKKAERAKRFYAALKEFWIAQHPENNLKEEEFIKQFTTNIKDVAEEGEWTDLELDALGKQGYKEYLADIENGLSKEEAYWKALDKLYGFSDVEKTPESLQKRREQALEDAGFVDETAKAFEQAQIEYIKNGYYYDNRTGRYITTEEAQKQVDKYNNTKLTSKIHFRAVGAKKNADRYNTIATLSTESINENEEAIKTTYESIQEHINDFNETMLSAAEVAENSENANKSNEEKFDIIRNIFKENLNTDITDFFESYEEFKSGTVNDLFEITEEKIAASELKPDLVGYTNHVQAQSAAAFSKWQTENAAQINATEIINGIRDRKITDFQGFWEYINGEGEGLFDILSSDSEIAPIVENLRHDLKTGNISGKNTGFADLLSRLYAISEEYGDMPTTNKDKADRARNAINNLRYNKYYLSQSSMEKALDKKYAAYKKEKENELENTLIGFSGTDKQREEYEAEYWQSLLSKKEWAEQNNWNYDAFLNSTDLNLVKGYIGNNLLDKISKSEELSGYENAYINNIINNAALGISGLTTGQKLKGAKYLSELDVGQRRKLITENEDIANAWLSDYSDRTNYLAALQVAKGQRTGEQNKAIEDYEKWYKEQSEKYEFKYDNDKNASKLFQNFTTLTEGSLTERMAITQPWVQQARTYENAQRILGKDSFTSEDRGALASVLGLEDQDIKDLMKSDSGKQKLQNMLRDKTSLLFDQIVKTLNVDIDDSLTKDKILAAAREKGQDTLDAVNAIFDTITDWAVDANGQLVVKGVRAYEEIKIGDYYEQGIEAYKQQSNTARAAAWISRNAGKINALTGSPYSYNEADRYGNVHSVTKTYSREEAINKIYQDAIKNGEFDEDQKIFEEYLKSPTRLGLMELVGQPGYESVLDLYDNAQLSGGKYKQTLDDIMFQGLFGDIYKNGKVDKQALIQASKVFTEDIFYGNDIAKSSMWSVLTSDISEFNNVMQALRDGHYDEAIRAIEEAVKEMTKNNIDELLKNIDVSKEFKENLEDLAGGGTKAIVATQKIMDDEEDRYNRMLAMKKLQKKDGSYISGDKIGGETKKYIMAATGITAAQLKTMDSSGVQEMAETYYKEEADKDRAEIQTLIKGAPQAIDVTKAKYDKDGLVDFSEAIKDLDKEGQDYWKHLEDIFNQKKKLKGVTFDIPTTLRMIIPDIDENSAKEMMGEKTYNDLAEAYKNMSQTIFDNVAPEDLPKIQIDGTLKIDTSKVNLSDDQKVIVDQWNKLCDKNPFYANVVATSMGGQIITSTAGAQTTIDALKAQYGDEGYQQLLQTATEWNTLTGENLFQKKRSGGGGGKSALQKLLQKQERELIPIQHENKMLEIREKQYDYNNDYTGWKQNIDDQISGTQKLVNTQKEHIKQLEEERAKKKEDSDEWWNLTKQINSNSESLEENINQLNELTKKRLEVIKQEAEEKAKPGTHISSMLEQYAERALATDRFADYERFTQQRIDEKQAESMLHRSNIENAKQEMAQAMSNKDESIRLKRYDENGNETDAWKEYVDYIQEEELAAATADTEYVKMKQELNQQRLSQIAKVVQYNTQTASHNSKLASTYASTYESGGYRDQYESMLHRQMSENNVIIDENRRAEAEAQARMIALESEGKQYTTEWYEAQAAVYGYQEAIEQTTMSQLELSRAIVQSDIAGAAEDYADATRDLTHVNEMLQTQAQEFLSTKDYEGYYKAIDMYTANLDVDIKAKQDELAKYKAIYEAGMEAKNLTPAEQRELLEDINNAESYIQTKTIDKDRSQREKTKVRIDKMFEDQDWAASEYEHNMQLLGYQNSIYQNNGELTNVNTMIEEENKLRNNRVTVLKKEKDALEEELKTVDAGSDEEKRITEQIKKHEEAILSENTQIDKNTKLLDDNKKKIVEIQNALQDAVDQQIEAEKKHQKDILAANVSVQDQILQLIKKRLTDEWDLKKKDIQKEKEALNEYKKLINERLNYRKKAAQEADKEEEMAELRRQLALIEADPTRTKDAKEIRRKLEEMEEEKAWSISEDEVNAESERIDNQTEGMDQFVQYNEELLNEILGDANNFAAEINDIMSGSVDNILGYLETANEEFAKKLPDSQKQMIESWTDTIKKAKDILESNYSEILKYITSEQDLLDYIHSVDLDYRAAKEAGNTVKMESIDNKWKEKWKEYINSTKTGASFTEDNHTLGTTKSGASKLDGDEYKNDNKDINKDTNFKPEFDEKYNNYKDLSTGEKLVLTDFDEIYSSVENIEKHTEEIADALGTGDGSSGSTPSNRIKVVGFIDSKGVNNNVAGGNYTTIKEDADTDKEAVEKAASLIEMLGGLGTAFIEEIKKTVNTINPVSNATVKGPSAEGSLVDYTGYMWVDGTMQRPESFLDATDTALLRSMLDAYNKISYIPSMSQIDTSMFGNNTSIGDINITINQAELKTDEDIDRLAKRVGQAFSKELQNNGINLSGYSF